MAAAMGGGGGVDGSRSMGCGGGTLGLDALGGIGNLPMSQVAASLFFFFFLTELIKQPI